MQIFTNKKMRTYFLLWCSFIPYIIGMGLLISYGILSINEGMITFVIISGLAFPFSAIAYLFYTLGKEDTTNGLT